MILVNGLSGQIMNRTKIGDLIPDLNDLAPALAHRDLAWAMGFASILVAAFSMLFTFHMVYKKLGSIMFIFSALPGLLPLLQWLMALGWMFKHSEWAWSHPMLALAILTPSFSMINSKMIVCTVANMQPVMEYTTFSVFFLFAANKPIFDNYLREEYIALGCFLFEGMVYSIFVYATISQITKFLDINCLFLKEPKDTTAEAEST